MTPSIVASKPGRPRASISAVVTCGEATEIAFVFNAGSTVGPFSVGTLGDWHVSGSGVAPVHFYLCFDGETLFGAAGPEGAMTLLAGEPLGPLWTKLPDTCELCFGGAAIALMRSDPRGPRIVDPFAAETIAKPFVSFVAGCVDPQIRDPFATATVMRQPYDAAARRSRPQGPAIDPLAAETIAAPFVFEHASPGKPEHAAARPAAAATSRAPRVRQVMAGLVVAAVVLMGARAFKARSASKSVATLTAAASARPAPSSASKAPGARATPPSPAPPLAPLPSVDGRTPEREAVDRVARGAYAEAAVLYAELARRTNDPTFRAAARIARRKVRVP